MSERVQYFSNLPFPTYEEAESMEQVNTVYERENSDVGVLGGNSNKLII